MSGKRAASGGASRAAKVKKLPKGFADFRSGDERTVVAGPQATQTAAGAAAPTRLASGELKFADAPDFRPRLTPRQVVEAGAFGGCYFRPITSLGSTQLRDSHREFAFLSDVGDDKLCRAAYAVEANRYGVSCGGSLAMWESKGWISALDPYGWFQWYCCFFAGRRSTDDARQISRWKKCAGPTGRWRNNLITKVVRARTTFDDAAVSPVVRQTLLHWAYELNENDFEARKEVIEERLAKKK